MSGELQLKHWVAVLGVPCASYTSLLPSGVVKNAVPLHSVEHVRHLCGAMGAKPPPLFN